VGNDFDSRTYKVGCIKCVDIYVGLIRVIIFLHKNKEINSIKEENINTALWMSLGF
jgi:hypothetical protein